MTALKPVVTGRRSSCVLPRWARNAAALPVVRLDPPVRAVAARCRPGAWLVLPPITGTAGGPVVTGTRSGQVVPRRASNAAAAPGVRLVPPVLALNASSLPGVRLVLPCVAVPAAGRAAVRPVLAARTGVLYVAAEATVRAASRTVVSAAAAPAGAPRAAGTIRGALTAVALPVHTRGYEGEGEQAGTRRTKSHHRGRPPQGPPSRQAGLGFDPARSLSLSLAPRCDGRTDGRPPCAPAPTPIAMPSAQRSAKAVSQRAAPAARSCHTTPCGAHKTPLGGKRLVWRARRQPTSDLRRYRREIKMQVHLFDRA